MNAPGVIEGHSVRSADLADPAERLRIDAFVAIQQEASPFHRPQWSAAVERGCRQRNHFLVVERNGGAILGIAPLTEIRSALFGSALISTGFGVGGGILAENEPVARMLAEAALSLAGALNCPTVELRGGYLPEGWARKTGVYSNFARALPASDEDILPTIPRKQRAEVRRGLGYGMEVRVGHDSADRAAHYAVYSESVRNLGTPVFPKALFDAMLEGFGADADILTIRKDGKPVSSVLTFYFKGTAYPYWGGGTRAARHWRANEVLYYELMRHARSRGCARFDFGRSKLGTGAYAYKKNWGFEPEPLVYAVRTREGVAPREVNPLDPRYEWKVALWKKLPLWLANRLGPPIARGLG